MYLSHVPLNPARRTTRQLVSSRQRLHAAVLGCLPPGHRDMGRALWRLDAGDQHQLDLWIVSPVPPSFEPLIEQAGWTATPNCRTASYRRLLDSIAAGQSWVFRLEANPTISIRVDEGARGKRIPLVKREDQVEWLLKRQAALGFRVVVGTHDSPNLSLSQRREHRFDRRRDGQKDPVTILSVRFDGVLTVTEPEALRRALTHGVGSGKGYGCGLMTLAKLS